MYVEQVVETDNGVVSFKGTLTKQELETVVFVGLSVLLKSGSMLVERDEKKTFNYS